MNQICGYSTYCVCMCGIFQTYDSFITTFYFLVSLNPHSRNHCGTKEGQNNYIKSIKNNEFRNTWRNHIEKKRGNNQMDYWIFILFLSIHIFLITMGQRKDWKNKCNGIRKVRRNHFVKKRSNNKLDCWTVYTSNSLHTF